MRKGRVWSFKFKAKLIALIMIGFTTCGALQSAAAERDDGEKVHVVCTEPFPFSDGESLALSLFLFAQEPAEGGRATAEIIGAEGLVNSVDFAVLPGVVTSIDFDTSRLNGFFVGCVKSKGALGKQLDKLGKQGQGTGVGALGKLLGNFFKKQAGGLLDKIGLGCPCCCPC
jgi:hypothetical protein